MSKSSANQAPKPLSDADVAAYAEPDMNEAFRSLATEVQERRALDAKRRCDNCVHGRLFLMVLGEPDRVECDQHGAETYSRGWFCADWKEPK